MFPIVGTLYSSMKMTELSMKWEQRKKKAGMPTQEEEDAKAREIKRLQEDAEKVRKSNILSSIDGKLKAGGELTDEELQYLKENNPQLYQEAMEIRQEREEYKKQLQACKTKEDVQKLHLNKMSQFLSQAKTVQNNPNIPLSAKVGIMSKILRQTMGIQKEQHKFVQSGRYHQLPDNEEEIRRETEDPAAEKASETEKDERTAEEIQEELAGILGERQEQDGGEEIEQPAPSAPVTDPKPAQSAHKPHFDHPPTTYKANGAAEPADTLQTVRKKRPLATRI